MANENRRAKEPVLELRVVDGGQKQGICPEWVGSSGSTRAIPNCLVLVRNIHGLIGPWLRNSAQCPSASFEANKLYALLAGELPGTDGLFKSAMVINYQVQAELQACLSMM